MRNAKTLIAGAAAICFGMAYAGPTPHMYGALFGLAPEQTVRVSIASVDDPNIRGLPPGPCSVQLKLFGADGAVLVDSGLVRVAPGASFSQDIRYSDLVSGRSGFVAVDPSDGLRAKLRAASYLSSPTGQKGCPSDSRSLKLSIEVFDDASGRTTFMVPTGSFVPAVQ
jgi:hypothetical protein